MIESKLTASDHLSCHISRHFESFKDFNNKCFKSYSSRSFQMGSERMLHLVLLLLLDLTNLLIELTQ